MTLEEIKARCEIFSEPQKAGDVNNAYERIQFATPAARALNLALEALEEYYENAADADENRTAIDAIHDITEAFR